MKSQYERHLDRLERIASTAKRYKYWASKLATCTFEAEGFYTAEMANELRRLRLYSSRAMESIKKGVRNYAP